MATISCARAVAYSSSRPVMVLKAGSQPAFWNTSVWHKFCE